MRRLRPLAVVLIVAVLAPLEVGPASAQPAGGPSAAGTIACTTNAGDRAGQVMAICSNGFFPNNVIVMAKNSGKLSGQTLAEVVAQAEADLQCTACVGTVEVEDGSVTVAKLAAGSPDAGQVLSFDGSTLVWRNPATGTISGVNAGTGLSGGGSSGSVGLSIAPAFQLPQGCSAGKIASWNGSAWSCGSDQNTTYSAGTGLSLSGTAFSVNPAAVQARVTGTCGANQAVATIAQSGSVTCNPFPSASGWGLTGNAGTTSSNFIGTTDNQPLVFKVNGTRVLLLQPTASVPNVVAGSSASSVTSGVVGATIAGGGGTTVQCGGNTVTGSQGTVGGGCSNSAGVQATVGGGTGNYATNTTATVGGGSGNNASGIDATIGGGASNIANVSYSSVLGGQSNHAAAVQAMIGGGYNNVANGLSSVVAGGDSNTANGSKSVVGGGSGNVAGGDTAVVGGGNGNQTSNTWSTIGGGNLNTATGSGSTVAGGSQVHATGGSSSIGGGSQNNASGIASTIPGGAMNTAKGNYSFAAGLGADAEADGEFVWADASGGTYSPLVPNSWNARSTGGFFLLTNHSGDPNTGCTMAGGTGNWVCTSDRHTKTAFRDVGLRSVLRKLATLPLTTWRFKAEAASVRHMGPMAQDFMRVFHLGTSNKTIGMLDEAGVSLAAVKALLRRSQRQAHELQATRKAVRSLRQRLRQERRVDRRQDGEISGLRHDVHRLLRLTGRI
jgi:trimeric autotransporter adhesin